MSELRERIYQRTGFSNVELDAVMAVVGPLVEQLRQAEVSRDAYLVERNQQAGRANGAEVALMELGYRPLDETGNHGGRAASTVAARRSRVAAGPTSGGAGRPRPDVERITKPALAAIRRADDEAAQAVAEALGDHLADSREDHLDTRIALAAEHESRFRWAEEAAHLEAEVTRLNALVDWYNKSGTIELASHDRAMNERDARIAEVASELATLRASAVVLPEDWLHLVERAIAEADGLGPVTVDAATGAIETLIESWRPATVEAAPTPSNSKQLQNLEQQSCPDGATCHRDCSATCWRVQNCGPLSGVYRDDRWPTGIRIAHAAPDVAGVSGTGTEAHE